MDGGMGTSLEANGLSANEAWSAAYCIEDSRIYDAVKLSYEQFLSAGVDILTCNTYNLSEECARARGVAFNDDLFLKNMELARACVGNKDVKIAASLGGFATTQLSRAETAEENTRDCYIGVPDDDIRKFHKKRITHVLKTNPDILLFETIPSLREVKIITELVPDIETWVTMTCANSTQLDSGDLLMDCVIELNKCKNVKGIGVNCTAPQFLPDIVSLLESLTLKKRIIQPNSGELYDIEHGTALEGQSTSWKPRKGSVTEPFESIGRYFPSVQIIGGCCRVTFRDIERLRNSNLYKDKK